MSRPRPGDHEYRISRAFGVEYELGFPLAAGDGRQIAAELQRISGLPCQYYAMSDASIYTVRDYWKLVPDSTVRFPADRERPETHRALELVSPKLKGAEGLAGTFAMVDAAAQLRAATNTTSGHHVHVDATDMSVDEVKRVCVAFIAHEKVFDLLTSRSRQGNDNPFCKSNQAALVRNTGGGSLQAALDALAAAPTIQAVVRLVNPDVEDEGPRRADRHFKLNVTNLGGGGHGHGTIEFRLHQGTADPAKTMRGVVFLQGFVYHPRGREAYYAASPRDRTPAQLWLQLMHTMSE